MINPDYKSIAIVGINRDSASLLSGIIETHSASVVRVINPDIESLEVLRKTSPLDAVVNTTGSEQIHNQLKQLKLAGVDILSGLSAKILFLTGKSDLSTTNATDRKNVLASLSELKQAVFLSKNKDELLKLLLSVAIRTCNADNGSIMLADNRKRVLKIEMSNGLGTDVIKSTAQRYGSGIAGKVARSGKAILITPDTSSTESDSLHLVRKDIVSSMCCPLLSGNEVMGVLNISSKSTTNCFNQNDIVYLQELSDFMADVINTSKEYDETASSHFAFAQIAGIQEILSRPCSLDEKINLLVMRVANSFNAVICNYYTCIPEQKIFLVQTSSSFNKHLLQGKKIKLNDHIATSALSSTEPVVIDGGLNEMSLRKWYVAIPILIDGICNGLLFVHFCADKTRISAETDLLVKIGSMLNDQIGGMKRIEQLNVQSTRLSAVSEATFSIATAADLTGLVNFSLPNACLIFEAEAALFWLLNPTNDTLELYSSFSIDETINRSDLEKIDMHIYNTTTPNNDVQLITDLSVLGFPCERGYPRSVLSKSFGNGTTIAAVFSIFGRKSLDLYGSKRFTQSDRDVFGKFCFQFSNGLSRLVPFFSTTHSLQS